MRNGQQTRRRRADAVFEGGGVKGIGLVGAVVEAEARGYQWVNVAGTSAGAIVAALLAAGYTGAELHALLLDLDYRRFLDPGPVGRLPVVGPFLSLLFANGLYTGRELEGWLRRLLAARGVRTFGDLVLPEFAGDPRYRYRLRVIASDLTRGRMLVLPQDSQRYGYRPDDLDVAWSVRMSTAIPLFYEPVLLPDRRSGGRSLIVDGGVLSNFPVWLFDTDGPPPWPTFGFKLVEPGAGRPRAIRGPITLFTALFATMMEAHDARYIEDAHFRRTIAVPTLGVGTVDFDLSRERAQALYESGRAAAAAFFDSWDFDRYVDRCRREPCTLAGGGRGRRLRGV